MNQQDKHPISDYQLERYLLREGTDDELAALDRRVADDPELAQRLAALERSNEELHRRYPPEWMRGQIELKLKRLRPELSRRVPGRRVQRTWSGYRLWAVPAVALILAVVAVPTLFDQEPPEVSETRIKGGEQEPRLLVFRKLASGVERLEDGDRHDAVGDLAVDGGKTVVCRHGERAQPLVELARPAQRDRSRIAAVGAVAVAIAIAVEEASARDQGMEQDEGEYKESRGAVG